MGADRISDPELARRLVLHEARAQQTPGRELRDLGDGWLFHDPSDAEPFWNRLIAPRWPTETAAFDRRLDEVITLFASLGRLPHVRPLPVGGEPGDLAERLHAAGFETVGADRRMVMLETGRAAELAADAEARVAGAFAGHDVTVSAQAVGGAAPAARLGGRRTWGERRRWAGDASVVLGEAFRVEPGRRVALEHDVLACINRPACSVLLLAVDGEPAAVARRATAGDGTYLSSIGTRPAYRGRGLGALITMLAVRDAIADGSELIHLAVEDGNDAAVHLYERLGFVLVGDPAPDLLLH